MSQQNNETITFDALHRHMELDPFYGIESSATESIINSAHRESADNALYRQFASHFSSLPRNKDQQRYLIYLWCGMMGLPSYRDGTALEWEWRDFLDNWDQDFEIRLDELKDFLKRNSLPLPVAIFPNDEDNTEKKVALDEAEFERAFDDFAILLPQLEDELEELKRIQPESMEARSHKKSEIENIDRQITAIYSGDNKNEQETPEERKQHLERCYHTDDVPAPRNRFVLTGDHWSITFQGQTGTFNDTKGLRYVAWLIRNQGNEIPVSDLYYAVNPPDSNAIDSIHSSMSASQLDESGLSVGDLGDAGDTLTPEAKKRLEKAIYKIRDQIEEAKEFGEDEKAAQLEQKLEDIVSHLAAESGLGGKPRKASSGIERLRKAVTKRIRGDIKKITSTFPDLGHHLEAAVHTGTQCQYSPHPPVEWSLDP